jgi:hypothetical protein
MDERFSSTLLSLEYHPDCLTDLIHLFFFRSTPRVSIIAFQRFLNRQSMPFYFICNQSSSHCRVTDRCLL